MHLPAVIITLTLLSLYIAKVSWDEPSANALNALQFAAKAHESVILISFGDILLCRISHGLNHQDVGVPLGFLSSPFYLAAPLRYLASRQLWVPTFKSSRNAKYQGATGTMVVLVSVLCIAASPLSAIAMIPRLGWWKDDQFSAFDDPDVTIAKWIRRMEYRASLSGESGPFLNNTIDPSTTPRDVLLSASGVEFYSNFTYTNYEVTYSNILTARLSTYSTITEEYTARFAATCPLAFVSSSIEWAAIVDIDLGESVPWLTTSHQQVGGSGIGKPWKQPLVTVECTMSSSSNENVAEFSFQSLNETLRLTVNESSALADLHDRIGSPYRFVNLRESKGWPISADIMFVTTEQEKPAYHLCAIIASWIDVDTWIESFTGHAFRVKDWKLDDLNGVSPNSWFDEAPDQSRDLIHMDGRWMEGTASFSNKSFFSSIAEKCEDTTPTCFELYLALHITDAVAQAGNNDTWPEYFSNTGESDDDAQDAMLYMRYYRTYAYRFGSSRGIPFAFSFLLLHVLMVLAHLIEIILSEDPWHGSDWDNFGDTLVLALASKPPDDPNDLTQQSSESDVWKKIAIVVRDGEEIHYQIRLREEKGYQRTNEEDEE
ncbi:hypothetical protein LB505_013823 [Fusarium chuoi]|nr:hypothetical protein LB505_013823 [Fusarium chuoi]